ncbi:hypothetical protein B5S32_g1113 [[Candida] boidinii]|nr:hypothetical protein B5S32_g1113 [[Candida] boidinii]
MEEQQGTAVEVGKPHEAVNLEKEQNVNKIIKALEDNEKQNNNCNSIANANYSDTNMSMFCSSMDVSNITEKTIEEIRLDIRENELDKETYLENLFKETKEKLISPMEPIKKFNWDDITQIIEGAYNDYTSEMQSIISKFEKVDVVSIGYI